MMSKLSFRARAIDANKPMPVYRDEEIPDLIDFAAVNRAVLEMPTGMEKDEETEHHLQRALSAQQVYGTAEALVIPIPDMDVVGERYLKLYGSKPDFRAPKQYIHVQPFGMDQDIPEYDMDSEDEQWLNRQVKHLKMDVSSLKFESMMDRLEKGSGQMVVTLNEAKALLKVDDDLIIAVYDYWLNKRLRLQHALIPQVRTEKRDGSTTNNPYVAFRRRTEKMQTRKNRKNDEVSYEKMLKLKKDLNKALIILELLKRREKSKKELLKLTVEVAEKRYQMQDWDGKLLADANAKKHTLPSFFPITYRYQIPRDWDSVSKEPGLMPARKKREYKKRKHKQSTTVVQPATTNIPSSRLQNYVDVGTVLHRGRQLSSDEDLSGASQSDHEAESDPDGVFAFRRKAGCCYHSVSLSDHMKLQQMAVKQCDLHQRQRIVFDRGYTEWDEGLAALDVKCATMTPDSTSEYVRHIRHHSIPFYRRKVSDSGERSTETSLKSMEVSELSVLVNSDGLRQMHVGEDNAVSNVGHSSSDAIDSATGQFPDVGNSQYGYLCSLSSQRLTNTDNNLASLTATSSMPNNVYPSSSAAVTSASNSGSMASFASSGSLRVSAAADGLSLSSLHAATIVVTNSRYSVTDSVGLCAERPMASDSVRAAGNCVAPISSASPSNHSSSALRGPGPACVSTSLSFSSAPLLKSPNSAIHRKDTVSRDGPDGTDMPAVIMEVT